jgi:hypothetical protein
VEQAFRKRVFSRFWVSAARKAAGSEDEMTADEAVVKCKARSSGRAPREGSKER